MLEALQARAGVHLISLVSPLLHLRQRLIHGGVGPAERAVISLSHTAQARNVALQALLLLPLVEVPLRAGAGHVPLAEVVAVPLRSVARRAALRVSRRVAVPAGVAALAAQLRESVAVRELAGARAVGCGVVQPERNLHGGVAGCAVLAGVSVAAQAGKMAGLADAQQAPLVVVPRQARAGEVFARKIASEDQALLAAARAQTRRVNAGGAVLNAGVALPLRHKQPALAEQAVPDGLVDCRRRQRVLGPQQLQQAARGDQGPREPALFVGAQRPSVLQPEVFHVELVPVIPVESAADCQDIVVGPCVPQVKERAGLLLLRRLSAPPKRKGELKVASRQPVHEGLRLRRVRVDGGEGHREVVPLAWAGLDRCLLDAFLLNANLQPVGVPAPFVQVLDARYVLGLN